MTTLIAAFTMTELFCFAIVLFVIIGTILLMAVLNTLYRIESIVGNSYVHSIDMNTATIDDPYVTAYEGDPLQPDKRINTIRR